MKKITFEEMLDGNYDYHVAMDLVSDAMYLEECLIDYQNLVREYHQETFLLKRYFDSDVLSYVEEYHSLMITQGNCLDVHDIIKALRAIEDSKDLQFLDEFLSNHVPLSLIDDYTVKVKPTILSHASSAEVNHVNPFHQQLFGEYFTPDLAEAVRVKPCSDFYKNGAYLWINSCCDFINTGNPKLHSYILDSDTYLSMDSKIFCDRNLTLWHEDPCYPVKDDSFREQFAQALIRIQELLYNTVEHFFKLLNSELNSTLNRIGDYQKIFIYNDLYIETRQPMFLVDDKDNITHIIDEDGNSIGIGFVDTYF